MKGPNLTTIAQVLANQRVAVGLFRRYPLPNRLSREVIRLGVEFQAEELAQSFSSSLVMKLPSLSTMMGVPSIHSGQFSETQVRVAHSQMS